jgi:surface protein
MSKMQLNGGHETVINNANIKFLVWDYINKKKSDLPNDLKDKPIGEWDVSRVTDMSSLFRSCYYFNEDISRWDVSNVTNMSYMFSEARAFNQPIGEWNVSKVINMSNMFQTAQEFNQPIGSWNVSNVTYMKYMFQGAFTFNQPIGSWNVSNVTNMMGMFEGAQEFNQPIGTWNVSNVTNMTHMFYYAVAFNQPLNQWNITNARHTTDRMFAGSGMSPSKYPGAEEPLHSFDITKDYLEQLGYSKQAIQFIVDQKMYDENFMSYVEEQQNKTGIDYNDPIFFTLMVDPVQASDGKVYERDSIITIINERNPVSPLTREPLDKRIPPADERRKQINQLINKYIDDKEYEKERPKRTKRHGHFTRKGKLVLEAESNSKTHKSKSKSKSPRNAFDPHAPLPNISHFPSFPHLGSERLASLALKPKTKKRSRSRSASRGGKTRNARNARKTMKK